MYGVGPEVCEGITTGNSDHTSLLFILTQESMKGRKCASKVRIAVWDERKNLLAWRHSQG